MCSRAGVGLKKNLTIRETHDYDSFRFGAVHRRGTAGDRPQGVRLACPGGCPVGKEVVRNVLLW